MLVVLEEKSGYVFKKNSPGKVIGATVQTTTVSAILKTKFLLDLGALFYCKYFKYF